MLSTTDMDGSDQTRRYTVFINGCTAGIGCNNGGFGRSPKPGMEKWEPYYTIDGNGNVGVEIERVS